MMNSRRNDRRRNDRNPHIPPPIIEDPFASCRVLEIDGERWLVSEGAFAGTQTGGYEEQQEQEHLYPKLVRNTSIELPTDNEYGVEEEGAVEEEGLYEHHDDDGNAGRDGVVVQQQQQQQDHHRTHDVWADERRKHLEATEARKMSKDEKIELEKKEIRRVDYSKVVQQSPDGVDEPERTLVKKQPPPTSMMVFQTPAAAAIPQQDDHGDESEEDESYHPDTVPSNQHLTQEELYYQQQQQQQQHQQQPYHSDAAAHSFEHGAYSDGQGHQEGTVSHEEWDYQQQQQLQHEECNQYHLEQQQEQQHNPSLTIEIMPGMEVALRGSVETKHAMETGRIVQISCMDCSLQIGCIDDAEYVLCPHCKSVSPLAFSVPNLSPRAHGVGLGFEY